MTELTGQCAIISGGLGDIGAAIARELARRGAAIAVGDVRAEGEAAEWVSEMRALGARACYDRVDVTNADAVRAWVADVEANFGTPRLVVPNAAIVTMASVCEMIPADWSRELRTNLDGAFHLAQAAAKRLVAAGLPGRIVFVGSWAAHAAHPQFPAYCAAKAGIRMLCRCMALELAAHDILVNEVAPGYVNAGLTGHIFDEEPHRRVVAEQQVPIHRLIEPADVALQVAHLCSPENRHMTGSVLLMDGGLSAVNPGSTRDLPRE